MPSESSDFLHLKNCLLFPCMQPTRKGPCGSLFLNLISSKKSTSGKRILMTNFLQTGCCACKQDDSSSRNSLKVKNIFCIELLFLDSVVLNEGGQNNLIFFDIKKDVLLNYFTCQSWISYSLCRVRMRSFLDP